jgi:hypothetical protein
MRAKVDISSGGAGGWSYGIESQPASNNVNFWVIPPDQDTEHPVRYDMVLDRTLLTSLLQTLPLFVAG